MFEPGEGSRKDLILEFPSCRAVSWSKVVEDFQSEYDYTEMDLSCQGVALGIREGHNRAANQSTEQLLILQVSEAYGIEMALEELENTHVGR
jgi:hypothetical protein